MEIAEEKQQPINFVVVMMSRDPRLVREGYSAAETVRSQGFSSTVLEIDPGMSDQDLCEHVEGLQPTLAAFGVTAATFNRSLGASEAVMRGGKVPVLLFGRDLSLESERQKVPVEAAAGVVVGEPSITIAEYLRVRSLGIDKPVAGLDSLDGDYRPRAPGLLEKMPLPKFEEADLIRLRRDGLPMRLSLGCPRRCAFCNDQPREGRYRIRPAHEVAEEMFFHLEHNNVRRFQFCDLVINGDLKQLEAICDLMLEAEAPVEWWGRAVVDPGMPRYLYRKMRLAGCIGLDFDIFSGSDNILQIVSAGFTTDQATEALKRASAAGINTRVSVIVGLPGEAELEFGETAAWLQANRFEISQVKDIVPAVLLEGSVLLRNHAEYGISLPTVDPHGDWHDGGFNTSAYRIKRTREMRVFVEDALHLEVVGEAPIVGWDVPTREAIAARVCDSAQISEAETGKFRQENLHLAGVMRGEQALAGPISLEIDLTNNCNQHCAGCWIHSFMLGDDRISGAKRRATLDFGTVARLVRSAKKMGTKKIQLSGAGEPFMHPRIDDVIELIKDEGFELNVITNFTLMNEERARMLVDLGVDSVTVSFWAGTPETYVATHPTAKESLFKQIVEVVSHLTWYRRSTGANRPRVKIYNVISSLNAHEIGEMISTARVMGADLIEFTPVDVLPGQTDELALSDADSEKIMETLMNLRRRPDYLQRTAEEVTQGRLPGLDEQGEYARFLQGHRLPGDFRFSLDDIRRWETYCRRGVHCGRVYEEIHRDSCIFFGFPAGECQNCMAFPDCSIDPITLTVRAPYLSLQGFGSFWRRVAGKADGTTSKSDAEIVDRIPCSIGYTYARVQATGDVIPCCKADTFSLGNIMDNSFEEVWHCAPYEEFRRKALVTDKSDPYFKPMDCYKVCDNLGHNMATHDSICGLHPLCKDKLGATEE